MVANADQGYTDGKFGDGRAARESYIIMQGRFYPGTSVDRTLERMSVQDTWFLIGPRAHLHIISGATVSLPKEKNAHLCFSVSSVDTFIHRLKESNTPYESWTGEKSTVTTRPDGVKQIYFQDPDGYWLEINDAKE